MKKLITVCTSLCLLFLGVELPAQSLAKASPEFLKYSSGKNNEALLGLTTDNYGNIFCLGFNRENEDDGDNYLGNAATPRYYFSKRNSSGEIVWLKHFSIPAKGEYLKPEKIDLDSKGNIYLFGIYKGKHNFDVTGGYAYLENEEAVEFLAKYNSSGKLQWVKGYQSGFYSNTRDFVVDDFGNSYLLGYRANVVKINTYGEEIYREYLPNGATPKAICLHDNKLYIGTEISGAYDINLTMRDGSSRVVPGIEKAEEYFYNNEGLVACLSTEDGKMIWADVIRSSKAEEISGIGVDDYGNVTVLGTGVTGTQFGRDGERKLSGVKDNNRTLAFLAQYSANGSLKWVKHLKTKYNEKEGGNYGESLEVDPKTGHIFLTRANCNDGLSWAVYFDAFDKNGYSLDAKVFGYSDEYKGNNGFFKSSCGTANVFVHVNPQLNSYYIYGEGRSYAMKPQHFGSTMELPKGSGGTDYVLAKYKLYSNSTAANTSLNTKSTETKGASKNNFEPARNPNYQGLSKNGASNNSSTITKKNYPKPVPNTDAPGYGNIGSSVRLHTWGENSYRDYTYESFLKLAVINTTVDPNNFDQNLLNACVFYITNKERKLNGRAVFVYLKGLEKAAEMHSVDMVRDDFYSHINPKDNSKRDPSIRMERFGIGNAYTGENIAITGGGTYFEIANDFVQQWMDSPGHRRNILDPKFTSLGCGTSPDLTPKYGGSADYYGTQNFSSLR